MNPLYWYLAIGIGAVVLIVLAVVWSLRRMPSEAELDQLAERFPEGAEHCAAAARLAQESETGSGPARS